MRKPWMRKLKTFHFTTYGDMTQETAREHKSANEREAREFRTRKRIPKKFGGGWRRSPQELAYAAAMAKLGRVVALPPLPDD